MSIKQCAEHCNLSSPTIIKILNKVNVPRYKKAIVYNKELNEHYFSKIDTEGKAYFLGLIIADGNVFFDKSSSNRQASISITLNQEDDYMLKAFLDEVHACTTVGKDGRGACTCAVRSDIMSVDLAKLGVIPSKSMYTYLPPIPEALYPHLIRGIFDGDGSIQAKMNKQKYMHALSFCGTHDLMMQIADKINTQTGTKLVKVYDYKNRMLSEIKYQSIEDICKVGQWMYTDATFYLKRKRNRYNCFLKHYNINECHDNTEVI